MKYCEDLLFKWDKRIQFEATLLFFFSVVSGSSFVSVYMFTKLSLIINCIPVLYVAAMFCWWYVCKRMVFDTSKPTQGLLVANIIGFMIWFVIAASVSLGGWDEWGWNNKDVDVPPSDNFYRAINCLLVSFYIATLTYDYYRKIDDRATRIKIWSACIWIHAVISLSYFLEWVLDAYRNNDFESIAARCFAALGSFFIILWGIPVLFQSQLHKWQLIALVVSVMLYWWGSASLDCEFYADTADMTVMVGYQMIGSMVLLIVLESLPTMSEQIHILGSELLLDQDLNLSSANMAPIAMQPELINVEQDL